MLKNSKNLLKYLFSNEGYETTMEKASDIHYNIFIALACFIGYIILSSFLNLIGAGFLNAYKAIFVNFLLLFHLTKPEILTFVAATTPLVRNESEVDEAKVAESKVVEGNQSLIEKIRLLTENTIVAAKIYRKIVCHLLLIASVTDLALSIIPIRYNPNAVVYIILCGMIVVCADVVWGWKTKTFERATYWFVILAVVLNVALLVPDPIYRYLFDYAPSDISVKMMEKKIEKEENRGVLIKGIKALWDAGNDAAEKLRLKKEIERLKAAAEETARKLNENGNGNSNNELLEIAAPGTFPFKLSPYEKVKRKIFIKQGLKFSITSSRTDGDFFLTLRDRGDSTFHITKYYKTLPDNTGTFSILNGEKETTITLLVY